MKRLLLAPLIITLLSPTLVSANPTTIRNMQTKKEAFYYGSAYGMSGMLCLLFNTGKMGKRDLIDFRNSFERRNTKHEFASLTIDGWNFALEITKQKRNCDFLKLNK
tara:strand:+ start:911 stop:1231 length:321 start_codon:yes stop_codon:yes gene_type:complete